MEACVGENIKIVKLLCPFLERSYYAIRKDKNVIVRKMCEKGNLILVKCLFDRLKLTQEDLNYTLVEACNANNTSIASLCVDRGANNLNDCIQNLCSTWPQKVDVIFLLFQKGATNVWEYFYVISYFSDFRCRVHLNLEMHTSIFKFILDKQLARVPPKNSCDIMRKFTLERL